MTDMERSRIVELQHQGYGYKKISAITGLPLNTVKSFCDRHPVQIKEMPDSNALCRNCMTPLEQILRCLPNGVVERTSRKSAAKSVLHTHLPTLREAV